MPREMDGGYRPLADYGVIGSMYTAALVARDGSVDWCCMPQLDSPSVFAAILDSEKGGRWRIGPASGRPGVQRYLDRTNVLETTFEEPGGTAALIDFMPYWEGIPDARAQAIVRVVEGRAGEVALDHLFEPRFDYGRRAERLEPAEGGLIAAAGDHALRLWSDRKSVV